MKTLSHFLQEAKSTSKSVVMAFGRMNPPTVGHKKLVDKVKELADKYNAHYEVIVSHSQDAKKNPLTQEQKIKHAKRYFPGTNIIGSSKEHPNFIAHAKRLSDAEYEHLIMVAGQDRVKEFHDTLNKYNEKEFHFKKISVVSAGARDPDAEGVEGMSASKMRAYAASNNFNEFRKGVPEHVSDHHAKELFHDVRKGMNLHEELEEACWDGYKQVGLKKKGKRMVPNCVKEEPLNAKTMTPEQIAKKHNVGLEAILRQLEMGINVEKEHTSNEKTAREIALDHLGENPNYYSKLKKYVESHVKIGTLIENDLGEIGKVLSLREDKVVYNVLKTGMMKSAEYGNFELVEAIGHIATNAPDYFFGGVADAPKDKQEEAGHSKRVAQDKEMAHKEKTTPSKYYAGLDKGTKEKRYAHFKKQSEKGDRDPSAYEPAPGDKEAKTKPSKHTLKYIKMYGEEQHNHVGRHSLKDVDGEKTSTQQHYGEHEAIRRRINKLIDMKKNAATDNEKERIEKSIESERIKLRGVSNPVMNEEAEKGLAAKAKKSGISIETLRKVYNRGMAAWRGGHRPGTTPQQWGMARVNSYITKGKGTYYGADADLSGKGKKKEKNENISTDYVGTGMNVPYYGSYDKVGVHNESVDEAFESYMSENVHALDTNVESHLFGTNAARIAAQQTTPGEPGYVGMGKEASAFTHSREGEETQKAKTNGKKISNKEDYAGADYDSRLSGAARASGGYGGSYSIGIQEESLPDNEKIRSWAMNESTQKIFTQRYGNNAAEKLIEAANRMVRAKTSFMSMRNRLDKEDYAPQAFSMGSGSNPMSATPETGYAKQAFGETKKPKIKKKEHKDIHEEIERCLNEGVDFIDNNYRLGSEKFFEFFRVARESNLQLEGFNKYLIEQTNIGEIAEYNGHHVPLDCPMIEEEEKKTPPLGQPKRGGPKKFYVYVRDPQTKNIKRVTWGDTTGLSVKMNNPEARKSFAARHRCSMQKDRTTAAYWACNTPRYAKQLGLSGGGNFFW